MRLGCLGELEIKGGRLSLLLSHPLISLLALSLLVCSQAPNLNTIHSSTLALISPLVRPPFRVGLEEKLLLVTGYAWTPRSWTTVEVCHPGFGKEPYREVSGPYRTKLLAVYG